MFTVTVYNERPQCDKKVHSPFFPGKENEVCKKAVDHHHDLLTRADRD